jgi:hypothetical protein
MSPVQCGDDTGVESFCQSDHRSVDGPERQITVPPYELRDPYPVARLNGHHQKVARREIAEKPNLGRPAETCIEQVGDFCDDELRDDERPRVSFEELETRFVMAIIRVDVGVERPRINDQSDREPPAG